MVAQLLLPEWPYLHHKIINFMIFLFDLSDPTLWAFLFFNYIWNIVGFVVLIILLRYLFIKKAK